MTNNQSFTEIQYDNVYINPDIKALGKALLKLQKKNKVLVLFEEDLQRKDRFITTRSFPLHFSELPRLSVARRKWKEIMFALPHLFRAQKVIYPGPDKSMYVKSFAADAYYRNSYQQKSFRLKNIKKDEFSFIHPRHTKGIVFQEYRFNVSRFFIELLKHFENAGGKIILSSYNHLQHNQLFLNELKTSILSESISVTKVKFNPALILPVSPFEHFEMITKENDITLRFFENKKKIQAEPIEFSKRLITGEDLISASKNYFSIDIGNIQEIRMSAEPSLRAIHEVVDWLSEPFSCSFENSSIENNYELCLEKYDLAKQTGISFNQFKPLFHRYGKGIDEITETAYALLNQYRDSFNLWEQAEKSYQKKYEWLKND